MLTIQVSRPLLALFAYLVLMLPSAHAQTYFPSRGHQANRWYYYPYGYGLGSPFSYSWPAAGTPILGGPYFGGGYNPALSAQGTYFGWPYGAGNTWPSTNTVPSTQGGFYSGPIFLAGFSANPLEPPPRMRGSYYPNTGPSVTPISYTPPDPTRARIVVRLPSSDAEVWFEGIKMGKTGLVRDFMSPPLAPASRYAYEIRVRWRSSQGEQTRTRSLIVRSGEQVVVDFSRE